MWAYIYYVSKIDTGMYVMAAYLTHDSGFNLWVLSSAMNINFL